MEYTASFQVSGEELEPSSVSEILGLARSHEIRMGEPRVVRGRIAGQARRGVWSLDSDAGERTTLEEHLDWILLVLQDRGPALSKLRSLGFVVEVFVGVFDVDAGSEVLLDSRRLLELGRLGIDLRLDLYPAPD
jgi:hypothetical protein